MLPEFTEDHAIRTPHASRFSPVPRAALRGALALGAILTFASCVAQSEDRTATPRPHATLHAPPATAPRLPQASATAASAAADRLPSPPAPRASPPPVRGPAGAAHGGPGPLIRGVALSSAIVQSPGNVSGTVYTDASVTSVVASSSGVTMALAKARSGVFTISYAIPPNVPFIFKRTYDIGITATAADGRTANASTAVTLR
jgi:hypothetical protein